MLSETHNIYHTGTNDEKYPYIMNYETSTFCWMLIFTCIHVSLSILALRLILPVSLTQHSSQYIDVHLENYTDIKRYKPGRCLPNHTRQLSYARPSWVIMESRIAVTLFLPQLEKINDEENINGRRYLPFLWSTQLIIKAVARSHS